MTRRVLLDTLKATKDYAFFVRVMEELLEAMPKNLREYFGKQMYIKHSHRGTYYTATCMRTGHVEYGITMADITAYLKEKNPKMSDTAVFMALKDGTTCFNHELKKIESTKK